MTELLHLAIEASLKAGDAILEIYGQDDFQIQNKEDESPLTAADLAANDIIEKILIPTGIPLMTEEGGKTPYAERKNWTKLWIIDPLDGTKEFIKRNGEFTVNIALIENEIPILGVVFTPVTKELYFSNKEIGAFKITLDADRSIATILSKAQALPLPSNRDSFVVVASRSHLSPETEVFIEEQKAKYDKVEMLSKGSSLKLCMVAEGSADCYPRFAPTMEWDTAAGQAICLYANCTVINWETKKALLYNKENLLNPWFLVGRND
ncbi:MAG: 3'(2'),5'-bisphosphate nucleotidase CysQ [Bacteroidetes bacterium]|nr:3'(2'),5'-bisphosphate nucleotidase CysQ [Bacteroidota bacterium]